MIGRFFPFILILVSAGLLFMYVDPTYDEIKVMRAEAAERNEALSRAKELQTIRDELLARYNTFPPEDVVRLNRMLPDHIDNVRLIIDIDQVAARYGMRVSDLNLSAGESRVVAQDSRGFLGGLFGGIQARTKDTENAQGDTPSPADAPPKDFVLADAEPGTLQSVVMSFSVASSYNAFLRFLQDLERSLRLVDVVGLSFDAKDLDFYTFRVTIKTYWLP